MKKILFIIGLIFFSISLSLNGQDTRCAGLKTDLENAEKKAEEDSKVATIETEAKSVRILYGKDLNKAALIV